MKYIESIIQKQEEDNFCLLVQETEASLPPELDWIQVLAGGELQSDPSHTTPNEALMKEVNEGVNLLLKLM